MAAIAKANLEQGQPFTEALLGDLALEHQLQDRARLLKALGSAAGRPSVVRLADRLIEAHGATVEWLTVVLAEVALGGPAALRPTPGAGGRGRWAVARLAAWSAGHARGRRPDREGRRAPLDSVGETSQDVAEALDDLQERAVDLQERATTAVKQGLAPNEDDLPVTGYDRLTKPRAIAAVKKLSKPEDVRTVSRSRSPTGTGRTSSLPPRSGWRRSPRTSSSADATAPPT